MHKLGFIVDMLEIHQESDLRAWAEFAAENGIDGLELMYDYRHDPVFDAGMVCRAIEGLPVEICACGLWWGNTQAAGEEGDKVRKATESMLYMARDVGCRMAFFNAGEYESGNTAANVEHLKEYYTYFHDLASGMGITVSCYIGHGGNFINRRNILSRVLEELPEFNLKLDPVGIMRNLKDDPYEIIKLYGNRCVHFHAKDILRYGCDGFEIEPPVGLGDLRWNAILGMLYHHDYQGYVVIEPHGPKYGRTENKRTHILLSKKHLEQFMIR